MTDTAMVLPVGLEPAEEDVMKQPPRHVDEPLLSSALLTRGFLVGLVIAAVALVFFNQQRHEHGLVYAQAIAFLSLVAGQWANALTARSETKSIFLRMFTVNYSLVFGFIAALILQWLVTFGPLKSIFHVPTLQVRDVAAVMIVSFVGVLVVGEIHKLYIYITQPKGSR